MRTAILLALGALATTGAMAQSSQLPNRGLEIVERFGGAAKMVVSADMESAEPPPFVIRDQESFEKFVALLPLGEISKTSTSTTNTDPLVKSPRFDWSRYMLLVVFDSQSLSFPPNVSRVEVRGERLTAYVDYPDMSNLTEAKPPEYGSYGAALVSKSAFPVDWDNPGHRAQAAQQQSMMMFLPNN